MRITSSFWQRFAEREHATPERRSQSGISFQRRTYDGLFGSIFANELQVDRDLDTLSDEDAACFERFVPVQAEVLAIDGGRRYRTTLYVPIGVFQLGRWRFDIEYHRLTDSVQSQVPGHLSIAAE